AAPSTCRSERSKAIPLRRRYLRFARHDPCAPVMASAAQPSPSPEDVIASAAKQSPSPGDGFASFLAIAARRAMASMRSLRHQSSG
ncbi:MAG: hypothetical protein NZT92_11315, partial [Abditibacteriales bacterium]|nr:hypothetical protein [Abditibacteriales bacterium]MDW8366174.1 hypothetical protein [Abditibacteriales bacterium]